MNSRLIYVAALFAGVYCISCKCSSKTIDCPGYEGKVFENWINYSDSMVLTFRTSSGEQKTFNLRKSFTTEPYQATSSWEKSVTCNAEQRFESTERDSLMYAVFGVSLREGDEFNGSAGFWINKTSAQFDLRSKDSIQSARIDYYNAHLLFNNTILLDNKSFSNVVEATRDTLDKKKAGIYKIYLAKQQGVVGYVEYPSLKLWVKQ